MACFLLSGVFGPLLSRDVTIQVYMPLFKCVGFSLYRFNWLAGKNVSEVWSDLLFSGTFLLLFTINTNALIVDNVPFTVFVYVVERLHTAAPGCSGRQHGCGWVTAATRGKCQLPVKEPPHSYAPCRSRGSGPSCRDPCTLQVGNRPTDKGNIGLILSCLNFIIYLRPVVLVYFVVDLATLFFIIFAAYAFPFLFIYHFIYI